MSSARPNGVAAGFASPETLLATSAVLGATALARSGGMYDPVALGAMGVAWFLAIASIVAKGWSRSAGARRPEGPAVQLLSIAVACACVWHAFMAPGVYLDPPQPRAFRYAGVVAFALVSTLFFDARRPMMRKVRFPGLLACFAVMAHSVVAASPRPLIDVWITQQIGATALLGGHNPYSITYPNPYRSTRFIAPALLEAGRIAFYPYPPVTLVLGTVALLVAGDIRYASAVMMACAAWAVRSAGRRSTIADAAAALILFQPTSFFVLEQGWTEPIVLGIVGVCLLSLAPARRPDAWRVAAAGGLLAASKQYAFFIAIPMALAVPARIRTRAAVTAIAVAAATLLPFLAWDPRELWRDLIQAQLLQPFRKDSLSFLVPIAIALRRPLTGTIGVAAGLATLGIAARRVAAAGQALAAAAASLLSFLLLNKQAFCNYYWLAVGLLLMAVSSTASEQERASGATCGESGQTT